MPSLNVQLRFEDGSIMEAQSINEAMRIAKEHRSIWKISWTDAITDERIRLIRRVSGPIQDVWIYEPLLSPEIAAGLFG